VHAPPTGGDAPPVSAPGATALGVAREVLASLEREGIGYCHWKGTREIARGLAGESDLDILFCRAQAAEARVTLIRAGFRPFGTVAWQQYPATEHYSALDRETGRLVHIHAHYRLFVGSHRLEEYRLPWEAELLASATLDPATGIRVPSPDLELLMLLLRESLKPRPLDLLLRALRGGGTGAKFLADFGWLRARADPDAVLTHCERLLGPEACAPLGPMLLDGPSESRLLALREAVRRALEPAARHSVWSAGPAVWTRCLLTVITWAASRLGRPGPRHRLNPTGGVVVAVVGPDGSGKSTVVSALESRFAPHIDTVRIYFGSGDGRSSLARKLLMPYRALVARRRSDGGRAFGEVRTDEPMSLRLASRLVWAVVLAWEKRASLRRAARASANGCLVLADRYPQCETMGSNDGPLLEPLRKHRRGLLRWLAEYEYGVYREAQNHPPDLVLRLSLPPHVAQQRKPEHSLSWMEARIRTVDALTFGGAKVVPIDASQTLEEVVRAAARETWDCL
jgi:hypothetical protein